MRIGIYGGSFNPIHIGHLHVADIAARQMNLDRVIFCPAGDPYMKDPNEIASCWDRLSMVSAAIMQDNRFMVSTVDAVRQGPTYTIDTMRELKVVYPHDDLFFIMGTDAFNQLPRWKGYQELLELTDFIVVQRKNEVPRLRVGAEFIKIHILRDEIDTDISSTQIRQAIREGKGCKFLMPNNVYEYILNHNLYK